MMSLKRKGVVIEPVPGEEENFSPAGVVPKEWSKIVILATDLPILLVRGLEEHTGRKDGGGQ